MEKPAAPPAEAATGRAPGVRTSPRPSPPRTEVVAGVPQAHSLSSCGRPGTMAVHVVFLSLLVAGEDPGVGQGALREALSVWGRGRPRVGSSEISAAVQATGGGIAPASPQSTLYRAALPDGSSELGSAGLGWAGLSWAELSCAGAPEPVSTLRLAEEGRCVRRSYHLA